MKTKSVLTGLIGYRGDEATMTNLSSDAYSSSKYSSFFVNIASYCLS